LTTTVHVADLLVSAAEVAVTATVRAEETDDGGVYVAALVVVLKVPQAFPLQPVPETLQVTPLLLESLLRVAARLKVCDWSMVVVLEGLSATEMGDVEFVPLPPPQPVKIMRIDKNRISLFMVVRLLELRRKGYVIRKSQCSWQHQSV